MKYTVKIFFTIGILSLIFTACSTTKPNINPQQNSLNSKSVTFPSNYRGKLFMSQAHTWPQFYDNGTYLYSQGKFELACDHFLKASELTQGEAEQTCLTAAAISALAGNDPRFNEIKRRLLSYQDDNQFKPRTITDNAVEALTEINRHYKEDETQ